MKINENYLREHLTHNLNELGDSIHSGDKADAIVEALNFLDHNRDWVEKINRTEIISMITNAKDTNSLIESIIKKVCPETVLKDALKEHNKKSSKKKSLTESVSKKKSLKEGTSNFNSLDNLPLLVFMTWDEIVDTMEAEDDYPKYNDFEDEDDYYAAVEEFQDNYLSKNKVCILDEDEVDDLRADLDQFNYDTKMIAYDLDVDENGYQQYGDNLNLEDIELTIEPGYYDGGQIDCKHENYFDYLDEDVKKAQLERFNNFLNEMKTKYGLSKLSVSARFSNGETWYKVDENLKEDVDGPAKEFIEELKEFKQFQIDRIKEYNGYDYDDVDIDAGGQDYEDCVNELLDIAQFYDKEFDNLTHTIESKVQDCVEKKMSIFEIVDYLIKDCKREFNESLKESEDDEDEFIYQITFPVNLNYLRQSINLTSCNSIKLLGKQPDGDVIISGTEEDLEKFIDDYFDKELDPNYTFKGVDYDTTILEPLDMKYSFDENLKEGYDPLSDALKDSGKSPIFAFDDGTVYGVEYKDGKLYAGSISNAGMSHQYEIDYDDDLDIDVNLQNLYDKIIETEPELLGEGLDDNISYVIYKENGKYKGTPKSNYDAQVRDANMVQDFSKFDDANKIVDYLTKNTNYKDKNTYKVIDEEYGRYKGEPYCEQIADSLEQGDAQGDLYDGGSYDLNIDGYKEDDFQCKKFFNYLLQEIAYPVRDGHLSYDDLEVWISSDYNKVFDRKTFKHDLEMLGAYDKEIFDKFYKYVENTPFTETAIYISYDTNYNDGEVEENLKEDNNSLARKMGAKFLPPKDYGVKKKRPRYVYEVYYYTEPNSQGDPVYRKFSSRKAQQEWYEKHKDDPDKFDMYAWDDAYIEESLKDDKNTNHKKTIKEGYYDYIDKDYSELLDSDVNVYDVKQFVLDESDGKYRTHYTDDYAIIVCANGKGCIVDYEAVGQDFDSVKSEIKLGIEENKDNEYTDEQGVVHKTLNMFATHLVKTTPEEIIEKAPKKTMKYREFFRKYKYNDRCASNFKSLAEYIAKNDDLSKYNDILDDAEKNEGCHSKKKGKKLKEGYIGQTLNDFFYDCVEPENIEKVTLWGEDDVVYEGDYDDAIDEFGDNEFIEFDCGMDKVVVNVDTSEEYQVTDYYVDVEEFIEFFNGDEIEVYDLNSGETLFSGYKEDCPDDVLEKIFISFDAPNYISINIEENDSDDDFDENLTEKTHKQLSNKQIDSLVRRNQRYLDWQRQYKEPKEDNNVNPKVKGADTKDKELKEGADGNTVLAKVIEYKKQGLKKEEIVDKVSKELGVNKDSVAQNFNDLKESYAGEDVNYFISVKCYDDDNFTENLGAFCVVDEDGRIIDELNDYDLKKLITVVSDGGAQVSHLKDYDWLEVSFAGDCDWDDAQPKILNALIKGKLKGTFKVDNTIKEDTVKQNGKWVNKGDTGKTHGTFKTKKEADAQRKAMFVNKKKNANWGK